MKKRTDELVFDDPTRLRLYAALPIAAGAILLVVDHGSVFWMLFDSVFIVLGLLAIVLSSDLHIVADGATRTLHLSYAFLLFHTRRAIPFDDIVDVQAQISRGSFSRDTSRRVYRLVAVLKDGRVVRFRAYFTGDAHQTQTANQLRVFITGNASSNVSRVPGPAVTLAL